MGAFADYLAKQNAAPAEGAAPAEPEGQFVPNLKRGARGALGSVEALGGNIAETLGADDAAHALYNASREQQAQANAIPVRNQTWDEVHNLGDAWDYLAGHAGAAVPAVVPAVAGAALAARGGGGAGARLLGSTLATVPMTAGDIVQRQQEDPTVAAQPADERLGRALVGGAASAAVQNVVPAGVAGKLAGAGGARSIGAILGHGAADVATQAGAGAGGEAISQLAANPGADLDTGAIKEAGIGGAAVGLPLAGAGVAGQLAHKAARAPGNIVKDVAARAGEAVGAMKEKAKDAFGATKEAASDAAEAVSDKVRDPAQAIRELADPAKAFVKRVADGEEFPNAAAFVGKTAEQVKAMMPQAMKEKVDAVTGWWNELRTDKDVPPEQRAQLDEAGQDLSNPASQMVVGGIKRGIEGTRDFIKGMGDLASKFAAKASEGSDGLKKSEDTSGMEAAIGREVLPLIKKARPELLASNDAINETGRVLRGVIDKLKATHEFNMGELDELFKHFGDSTIDVLDAAHRTIYGQGSAHVDQEFFGHMSRLSDLQNSYKGLADILLDSMKPELRAGTGDIDAMRTAISMIDHVRNYRDVQVRDKASGEVTHSNEYSNKRFMGALQEAFGDKADHVLKAVEKASKVVDSNVLEDRKAQLDEDGNVIDKRMAGDNAGVTEKNHDLTEGDREGRSIYYGPEKGGLVMHPDHPSALVDGARNKQGQAYQAYNRAKKENPSMTTRFVSAKDLGEDHPAVKKQLSTLTNEHLSKIAFDPENEAQAIAAKTLAEQRAKNDLYGTFKDTSGKERGTYGAVVAEGEKALPGTIDRTNIKRVMVDPKKSAHYASEGTFRVQTGEGSTGKPVMKVFDAPSLTREMIRQHDGETVNETGQHFTARMFLTGLAALSDHLGVKVDVPGKTVIDGKGTTYDQIKNLKPKRHWSDKKNDEERQRSQDLLNGLRKAYAEAKKRGDTEGMERLAKEGARLYDDLNREFVYDPHGAKPQFDSEGHLTAEGRRMLMEGEAHGGGDTTRSRAQKDHWWSRDDEHPLSKEDHHVYSGKDITDRYLKDRGESKRASEAEPTRTSAFGAREIDPFGEVHMQGEYPDQVYANMDGSGRDHETARLTMTKMKGQLTIDQMKALRDRFNSFAERSAPAAQLAKEGKALLRINQQMEIGDHKKLAGLLKGDVSPSAASELIKGLTAKYADKLAASEVAAKGPKGSTSGEATLKHDKTTTGTGTVSAKEKKLIRAYIDDVLGPQVQTKIAQHLAWAGDYDTARDIIRISAHALNPMHVAYHESLHAFFQRLADQGNKNVIDTLQRVAMSERVQKQLRERFKGQDAVLEQLKDPEESAAYMYQLWAAGDPKFTVAPVVKNIFQKIAKAIREALGVWSQSERAEKIMDYFNSGEFKDVGEGHPDVVTRDLIEAGHNKAVDRLVEFTKPLTDIAGAFAIPGGQRLRDMDIPALRQLADTVKPDVSADLTEKGTGRDKDTGFINAARTMRTSTLNKFGEELHKMNVTDEHIAQALQIMQNGWDVKSPEAKALSAEARLVARKVRSELLPGMLQYMKDAGVDLGRVAPRSDYFPRMYDANKVHDMGAEFVKVLMKHGITEKDAESIMLKIAASDGAEFTLETERPGFVYGRQRRLAMIPDSELAPFMKKNLNEILSSYVTQATRRAEWARRFGDDGQGVEKLIEQARKQGATEDQIMSARKYMKAVDGTLGDTMNPTLRRLEGNVLVYQNVRLLPFAIFSSVVDPLGVIVRGGTVGDSWRTFKRGMSDLRHAWSSEFKEDGDSRLAAMVGSIDHAIFDGTTSGLYTQGMVGDRAKRINDAFFRFNLMESFNRSMRIGATRAALEFMKRHADGTASPHSERWMRELGYEPGEFKFTDEASLDDKAKAAINKWVDGAVLRPDAADKPVWMNDPRFMLVSHLKQFVYSFQETILKRVIHEAQHKNFTPMMALTSYVPVMIASDALKGLVQGGGSQPDWKKDWGPADYLESGVERAGLLGVGQFALDGPGMIAGPTLQQLGDIAMAMEGKTNGGRVAVKSTPILSAFADAGPTFVE